MKKLLFVCALTMGLAGTTFANEGDNDRLPMPPGHDHPGHGDNDEDCDQDEGQDPDQDNKDYFICFARNGQNQVFHRVGTNLKKTKWRALWACRRGDSHSEFSANDNDRHDRSCRLLGCRDWERPQR